MALDIHSRITRRYACKDKTNYEGNARYSALNTKVNGQSRRKEAKALGGTVRAKSSDLAITIFANVESRSLNAQK
jgi:hypothetical protein